MSESGAVYVVYVGTTESASGVFSPEVSVVREQERHFVPVPIEMDQTEFATHGEATAYAKSRTAAILRERTDATIRFVVKDEKEPDPWSMKAPDARTLHRMLTAIDEAISHEVHAQREYRAKAQMYDCKVFVTLEKMEQGHEAQLRKLRTQVVERAEQLKDPIG